MLRVDTVYGNDDRDIVESGEEHVFKTLDRAIKVSKNGDTIVLPPGVFGVFGIGSRLTFCELKIIGAGHNTVCTGASFNGFFDFILEDLKCECLKITSSTSHFTFRNVRFMSMNTIELFPYDGIPDKLPNDTQRTTYITFDKCRFDYNFQIILKDGDYNLSFTSCEFIGNLPLIYAKKGSLKLNLTSMNFEKTLLNNDKAIVEYSHVSCNFPPDVPFFTGTNCMDKSRSTIQSSHALIESPSFFNLNRVRSDSIKALDVNDDLSTEYQKERDGAISFSSNDYPEIRLRKFTRLVNNTGEATLSIILPEDPENGHQVVIVSENADVIVEGKKYKEQCLIFGFIYDYGWIKYPMSFMTNRK